MTEDQVTTRCQELLSSGISLRKAAAQIVAEGGPQLDPKTIQARARLPSADQLSHISPDLRSMAMHTDALRFDPRNANHHPAEQKEALKASLAQFGQMKAIVANTAQGGKPIVIAGNATLEAAIALGWKHIAVNRVNVPPSVAQAYTLADKRTADMSAWDPANLAAALVELESEHFDLVSLGFDDDFIRQALANAQELDEKEADESGNDKPSDDEWSGALGGLPDGEKPPFQQMTFTLHDDQAQTVKEALERAKKMGAFVETGNENSNGNALARVCEMFLGANR
jgi:ParB-like chromosome segregation protein Spo0J